MAARLPKKVDFGVAVINIVQCTPTQMADECDIDQGDSVPDGAWDADTDTIYILKRLPLQRKREVLFHEMVHAAVDNQYWNKWL
jgi:Zn-dependent peptidase ImmA (M78 family)